MKTGTGTAPARAVGPLPYLLRWSDAAGDTSVELLTTIVEEISDVSANPVLLQGMISEAEKRTWTVLFTEPYSADALSGPDAGAVGAGMIGLGGPEDACAEIIGALTQHSATLPPSLLLITTSGEIASMALLDISSGKKRSLANFPASFDRLRQERFRPFETPRRNTPEPAAAVDRSRSAPFTAEPDQRPIGSRTTPGGLSRSVNVRFEVPHWVWALAFIFATGFFGITYGPKIWAGLHVPASLPAPGSKLGIRVTQHEKSIEIHWDSAAITGATSGALKMADGTDRIAIPLTQADLSVGRISYSPRSDDLNIELAVQTPAGLLSESVHLLMTKILVPASKPSTPAGSPALKTPGTSARGQTQPETTIQTNQEGTRHRGNVRAFLLPQPRIPEPVTALPPPQVQTSSATPAVNLGLPIPSAPSELHTQSPSMDSQKPLTSLPVTFQPAVPIHQTQPVVPNALRNALFHPTMVEVFVDVNVAGRVTSARTPNYEGSAANLAQLARDAARSWTFRPALKNGQPVASEYVLKFNFTRTR